MKQIKITEISGFTMIELLVVVAISMVVLTGVLQVFNTSNKSYNIQEEVAAMQQNLRIAKMFVVRDVRMAGSGVLNLNMLGTRLFPLDYTNSEGATGTDLVTIYYESPKQEPCGTSPDPTIKTCDQLPNLTLKGSMPESSAAVPVEEDLTQPPQSMWDQEECYCQGVTYPKPPYPSGGGQRLLIRITAPGATKSDSVYITSVQATGTDDRLINNAATLPGALEANCGPDAGVCNKVMNSYPAGSTISFDSGVDIRKIKYKVENNVLMRSEVDQFGTDNFQPLAENIEDFQVAFGLDTTNDGSVDTWINDAVLTDAQKDQIRLVRLSLLGRTSNRRQGSTSQTFNLEDHTGVGGQDGYSRRLLQTTIKVRNLGLL